MDKSLSGGKLINVTQYGNRLPTPVPPSRLDVTKEMARMKAEKDSLNAMEKVSPNPLYKKEDKKKAPTKKAQAKVTPDALKNMTQEELDELLASFAGSGDQSIMDLMKSATQSANQDTALADLMDKYSSSLSTPEFSFRDTQSFRAPGFFQG